MIYIVQEFYNGKWWTAAIYTRRFYAQENMDYLSSQSNNEFRIKEFEIPED